jgi:hypothetical protein
MVLAPEARITRITTCSTYSCWGFYAFAFTR